MALDISHSEIHPRVHWVWSSLVDQTLTYVTAGLLPQDHSLWSTAIWKLFQLLLWCPDLLMLYTVHATSKASTSNLYRYIVSSPFLSLTLLYLLPLPLMGLLNLSLISSNMTTCFKPCDHRITSGLSNIGVMVSGTCPHPQVAASQDWCWGCSCESSMFSKRAEMLTAVDGWCDVLCHCLQHLVIAPVIAAFYLIQRLLGSLTGHTPKSLKFYKGDRWCLIVSPDVKGV